MRLFTAIGLPSALRAHLTDLVTAMSGLRPCVPDQLHLTLNFIGEVNPRDLAPIIDTLAEVNLQPIELSAGGLFDSRHGALGLKVDATQSLIALQRDLSQALREIPGLKLERRRYHPHITLGRYRRGEALNLAPLVNALQRQHFSWQADGFELYRSELTPSGARYTEEARYRQPPSLRPRRHSTR